MTEGQNERKHNSASLGGVTIVDKHMKMVELDCKAGTVHLQMPVFVYTIKVRHEHLLVKYRVINYQRRRT